jgi:hypothetical protein
LYYSFAAGKNFNTAIWDSKYSNAWYTRPRGRRDIGETTPLLHALDQRGPH